MSNYLKSIMATLGAVLTGLGVYYGQTRWYAIVTLVVTSLAVYLVPNISPVKPDIPNTENRRDAVK